MIKIAFIFNSHKLSGKLTKLFTGCYCYHVCFVDEEAGHMYDMHLIRRRRQWPHYPPEQVVLFDCPGVTREYLEHMLDSDDNVYGVIDYLMFSIRPLFHLFGLSTWNAKGIICSEMINSDVWRCGKRTPFLPEAAPPDPCRMYSKARLGGLFIA